MKIAMTFSMLYVHRECVNILLGFLFTISCDLEEVFDLSSYRYFYKPSIRLQIYLEVMNKEVIYK